MKQGDAMWRSGHLINVGVISVASTTCTIEALCLQTSHPAEKPHTITIKTAEYFGNWTFVCSCKAGLGSRCKHICCLDAHSHVSELPSDQY